MLYFCYGLIFLIAALGYGVACAHHAVSEQTEWIISWLILVIGLFAALIRSRLARQILFSSAVFAACRYLIWRGAASLDMHTLANAWMSLIFLYAEIHLGFCFVCLIFFAWLLPENLDSSEPVGNKRPHEFEPSVDVFITTLNEPVEIVRKTVAGAVSILYSPKKVYVLDDGNRKEIEELAKGMGCGYIARGNRKNGKAGNINNALQLTTGEYVLSLDADHIVANTILDETLGYFVHDKKIGGVQTGMVYLNPAPLEKNLKLIGVLPTEARAVFWVYMRAWDTRNCAFWHGSGAVLRRSVLVEIGGVAAGTSKEDIHTTLKMNQKGYRFIYCPLPLFLALAPETLGAYIIQQKHWFQGNFKLLMKAPSLMPGLSGRR